MKCIKCKVNSQEKNQNGDFELFTNNQFFISCGRIHDIDDPDLDEDGLEVLSESRETKVKTSRRPLRSVLYYMKGYESSVSLTPVQLPPRSKILQVSEEIYVKVGD